MNGSMSNLLSGFCTSYVYIPLAAFLGALTAYTILQQKVNTKSEYLNVDIYAKRWQPKNRNKFKGS